MVEHYLAVAQCFGLVCAMIIGGCLTVYIVLNFIAEVKEGFQRD